MASLTAYKGLMVVEGATEAGGVALTDNFHELADRAPFEAAGDPNTLTDFGSGDCWLNTVTGTMWVCVAGAAWRSFYRRTTAALELIPEETSEVVSVKGKLEVTGEKDGSSFEIASSAPVAKMQCTTGVMQLFVDCKGDDAADANSSSVQLRDSTSQENRRTIILRYFDDGTEGLTDHFKLRHLVNGTTVGTFTVTPVGEFTFIGDGDGSGKVGIGVESPKANLHGRGSTIVGAAMAAVADADLGNGQVNIWVDQSSNQLKFKVKYSNGTIKSGSVNLS